LFRFGLEEIEVAKDIRWGAYLIIKDRVQCISLQVVMNRCSLNPEKNLAQIRLSFSRKTQKRTL